MDLGQILVLVRIKDKFQQCMTVCSERRIQCPNIHGKLLLIPQSFKCSAHQIRTKKMRKMSTFTRNLVLLSLLLSLSHTATCAPNTNVELVQCNVGTYSEGDPFAISLTYIIAELEDATPSRRGYDFYNVSPYPNAFAYGHAACNQTLTSSGCATCLAAAKTSVLGACDGRIGGRSVLYDCTVRYEQYPFVD